MNYDGRLGEWVKKGLGNGVFYMLIMQDLEDKEYFPVYFHFYSDAQRYQENIISESKLKVLELIKLLQYEERK